MTFIIFNQKNMLKQIERLKLIYIFLQKNKSDANSILNFLNFNNASISLRQLQRDIIDIENSFIQDSEKLVISVGKYQKKFWEIQKIDNEIIKSKIKVGAVISKSKNDNDFSFINTNFYKSTYENQTDEILNKLQDVINNRKYIQIHDLKNDSTGDNYLFKINKIEFAPIYIIKHRDAIYISGVENKSKEVLIYEIRQFNKFKILNKEYDYYIFSNKVKLELDNRFGITKNINDEIYDITLEFSSVTGALITKYFWHHSQVFEKSNGNLIMKMRCGINRELIGWIFQWMYNVRIIDPPVLNDIYKKTINEITTNQKKNKPLVYRNIFEPK